MANESQQENSRDLEAIAALESFRHQPDDFEDTSSDNETLRTSKKPRNEENDLTRLLRLEEEETRRMATFKLKAKISQGVQESLRDEIRANLAPIQSKLQSEVTEMENTAKQCHVELKDNQAAVVLARKKVRGSETKIVDSETRLRAKKKMQVLMKRFGDGEELDEGEMAKVLVVCKGGI